MYFFYAEENRSFVILPDFALLSLVRFPHRFVSCKLVVRLRQVDFPYFGKNTS